MGPTHPQEAISHRSPPLQRHPVAAPHTGGLWTLYCCLLPAHLLDSLSLLQPLGLCHTCLLQFCPAAFQFVALLCGTLGLGVP